MADPDTDKTRQAADKTPNAEAPRQDCQSASESGFFVLLCAPAGIE